VIITEHYAACDGCDLQTESYRTRQGLIDVLLEEGWNYYRSGDEKGNLGRTLLCPDCLKEANNEPDA